MMTTTYLGNFGAPLRASPQYFLSYRHTIVLEIFVPEGQIATCCNGTTYSKKSHCYGGPLGETEIMETWRRHESGGEDLTAQHDESGESK